MSARLLDGRSVRDQILAELRPRIARLDRRPGLAVVLVGNDPASEIIQKAQPHPLLAGRHVWRKRGGRYFVIL
jgi:hypothetical protein